MSNTSATGGPLFPTTTPAPLEGKALLDFFHGWIQGITGLDATLIRPRWQTEPPNLPQQDVNWLAFGITARPSDVFAAEIHNPSGSGYNEIRRHEVLTIAVSVYGPDADNYMHLLRDGMQVSQNRELLTINSMGLVESGDVNAVPELVKDKWYYRVDMTVRVRRQIVRRYAVLNIESATITLDNEHYTTQINV